LLTLIQASSDDVNFERILRRFRPRLQLVLANF